MHKLSRLALTSFAAAGSACALAFAGVSGGGGDDAWDADQARHLLNRAGFGARAGQVERALELGREAQVAELIAGAFCDPFFYEPIERPSREELAGLDPEARRKRQGEVRSAERRLLTTFAAWWMEQMLDGRDPLRERMTLFWHGHFTSSFRDVRDVGAMIEQNELLRRHALGGFDELVKGIVRDPAMLEYLD